ncbi:MAG TPA: pyruvoyl-dependent arginine decarboxylase [Candidatus Thermoplasmatota archaeon]|nr:pyruvoyl-dependent arginine decarboxylase [Candidatus Thermoplasmatota archaeon]
MFPLPTRFFVATGAGHGPTCEAAVDAARHAAGLGDANLVPVTGVLPLGVEQVKPRKIEVGGLRPAVVAEQGAPSGEPASAGLAWALREDHQGGYVVAGAGALSERRLKAELSARLAALSESRGVPLRKPRFAVAVSAPDDPPCHAAVAALVFLP